MDAQTVEWAVQFDSLPQHLKARWKELVALMASGPALCPPPPPPPPP
jgi:hypothetical protein